MIPKHYQICTVYSQNWHEKIYKNINQYIIQNINTMNVSFIKYN